MTNREKIIDKISTLSDTELAEMLKQLSNTKGSKGCEYCIYSNKLFGRRFIWSVVSGTPDTCGCEPCVEGIKKWLKQEAEKQLTAKWEINCDGYYPYCTNCGNEPQVKELTKFCPKCGAMMLNHRVDKQ